VFSDINLSHAKRCIAVGAVVDRIVRVHDQSHAIKREGPEQNFDKMQIEHKEDGPPEQEQSSYKAGWPQAQASLAARLQNLDPMETCPVEQGDKNQNERADSKRRERLEFIGNLSQECRDISPAVSVPLHTVLSAIYVRQFLLSDNCRPP
jgi:hypothetical protein